MALVSLRSRLMRSMSQGGSRACRQPAERQKRARERESERERERERRLGGLAGGFDACPCQGFTKDGTAELVTGGGGIEAGVQAHAWRKACQAMSCHAPAQLKGILLLRAVLQGVKHVSKNSSCLDSTRLAAAVQQYSTTRTRMYSKEQVDQQSCMIMDWTGNAQSSPCSSGMKGRPPPLLAMTSRGGHFGFSDLNPEIHARCSTGMYVLAQLSLSR